MTKCRHKWKYKKAFDKRAGLWGTFWENYEEYYCEKCLETKQVKVSEWHPPV